MATSFYLAALCLGAPFAHGASLRTPGHHKIQVCEPGFYASGDACYACPAGKAQASLTGDIFGTRFSSHPPSLSCSHCLDRIRASLARPAPFRQWQDLLPVHSVRPGRTHTKDQQPVHFAPRAPTTAKLGQSRASLASRARPRIPGPSPAMRMATATTAAAAGGATCAALDTTSTREPALHAPLGSSSPTRTTRARSV